MKLLTKLEEVVLLTVLRLEDDAYIVSIKDQIERCTAKNLSFGALYVSLNRLLEYGYLESRIGESSSLRGGRAKKFYLLTKEGISALKDIRLLQRLLWKDFDSLAEKLLDAS